MKKPKVSVIVSVYNTEKYVQKCIDSILNQTYPNIELILIDDCSVDNSRKILRKYKNKSNVILIENKKNSGLSYSRNIGLKNSTGEFIGYIDSDDYIDPNYYEKLVESIIEKQADIAVCDMKLYYEKTNMYQISHGCEGTDKIDFINNGLAASACNKLFKRNIIEKYPFAEGKVNEDIAVVIPALVDAKKIAYVPDVYYYYVQRDNSIQNSSFSEKRFDIFIGVNSTLKRIEHHKDYELYKDAIVYNQIICLFIYVFPKIEHYRLRKKYIKKFAELSIDYNVRQNRYFWKFLSSMNFKSRIYYKLLFKFVYTKHYSLASLFISFLNFFKKNLKRKIIPSIDIGKLIQLAQKNQKMKEIISISVVVPNYNYERYLEERLYSILSQKVKIFEILLLDDCSTDSSRKKIDDLVQKLSPYITIKKVYNEQNSGSAFKQWEKGFRLAKGQYIWIAEADDYCDKNMLKYLVRPIKKNKNVMISYCDTAFIDGVGKMILPSIKNEIDIMKTGHWDHNFVNSGVDEIQHYSFLNCTIANVSSTLIKNGNYQEYFKLSGEFKQSGDWLFYVNIMQHGDIAYNTKTLNYYRVHGNNVSSIMKKDAHLKEIKRIHHYINEKFPFDSFQKKEIKKRYSFLEKVWNLKK